MREEKKRPALLLLPPGHLKSGGGKTSERKSKRSILKLQKFMSRKFKKEYQAFSRDILAEFMTREELKKLDRKYTQAKIKRFLKKIEKDIS